jgi:hypothetical protein
MSEPNETSTQRLVRYRRNADEMRAKARREVRPESCAAWLEKARNWDWMAQTAKDALTVPLETTL